MTNRGDYFDDMYRTSDDPYGLRTRWYEERKRRLLLASLPERRFRRAYEPGCGVGELTRELAERCDDVLASDGSPHAVQIARERCGPLQHVRVVRHRLPGDWPRQARFDLVVLSELCYFLDADALAELARRCVQSLAPDATLVACDWRPDFKERVLPTDHVHAVLAQLGLPRLLRHEEDDFLLQVWSRDDRIVAQREGVR